MDAITYSHLRQNLASSIDECCENHEALIITRKGRQNQAVLMSKEDYDSLQETLHVYQTHDMQKLQRSIADHKAGLVTQRELLNG